MTTPLGRRRLLVAAAAAGLGLATAGRGTRATATPLWRWRGTALGADSTILLAHADRDAATEAIRACREEVARLERIFSLYRSDSALSTLNRQGRLEAPPPELVELLGFARRVSAVSEGAFDVTVQPLWELYGRHFAAPGADPAGPPAAALAEARALVDWRAVEVRAERITLGRPGMAVTLNGIAQGYITDRVADLLRDHGFTSVLVELGEIRALGRRPDETPWWAGIADPSDPGTVLLRLELEERALATSGGYGTWFDPARRHHHIFDPRTGRSAAWHAAVSVMAERATVADALSTALAASPPAAAEPCLAALGPATAHLVSTDGAVTTVQA
jgi:thiamine biosynthesis lipoprotein